MPIKLEVREVKKDIPNQEVVKFKTVLERYLKSNFSKTSSKGVSSGKNSSNGNYSSCNQ